MSDEPENPFADMSAFAIDGLPSGDAVKDVDLEERGRQFLADAKKRDAIARFQQDCEKGYPESDWTHPGLEPYRACIERVLAWQYGPRGILASGPTGRGKTRAIFGLYRRLACEEGRTVRYFFAGDWFSRLQEEVRYGRDDARQWVERIAEVPIVILDDLGQEAVTTARTDWAEAWFFRFLDIRIAKRLPLIVTTNLSAVEIAQGFSSGKGIRSTPLIRRLLELCDVVKFETPTQAPK